MEWICQKFISTSWILTFHMTSRVQELNFKNVNKSNCWHSILNFDCLTLFPVKFFIPSNRKHICLMLCSTKNVYCVSLQMGLSRFVWYYVMHVWNCFHCWQICTSFFFVCHLDQISGYVCGNAALWKSDCYWNRAIKMQTQWI